jgi:hypothetical protein
MAAAWAACVSGDMTTTPSLDGLLVEHPHHVELTGPLRSLAFPSRCANCGAVTTERLRVRKVFGRLAGRRLFVSSTRNPGYRIDAATVPYCSACIARDARERESWASRWRARLPSIVLQSIPALPCLGFAVFLVKDMTVPTHGENSAAGFELALALLFAVCGAGLIVRALWETRRYMVPRQTSVTLAFDFGPDISDVLDPGERRVYAMRDAAFADAFSALNRDRVWRPDPAAERTELRVWIACAVFLALGALAALVLNR